MADITDVELRVNGAQAEKEIGKVRKEVDDLKAAWIKAAAEGNKALADKISSNLKKSQRELRQMESGVKAVERTMKQLGKATPNDLNRALKQLQGELKNIERGSAAWETQVKRIKMVKAELEKVNAEMKVSKSLFERMKDSVNNWGASVMAGVGALSGLVMAGKKAVTMYAEMQQEEANVRKYTGMTAEEVDHLNEAFKKMDTRTSREELNKLAQEAGRLGLQSEEDVLGFVKAADKINVALDDLGEGATLTLSKLTDIFGDKQRLGVEQSLLSVGSVINELSQNSTASAPYLAEFAQRLAGVGAQAHMTIPEIMGFGAVLDSQGQKLEMSSTALSKVIMNLFKDPAKIANATGLAVEEFSETCKRSTNEGLLMLLGRLHELGGIDTLAPVFADMGENGARASAVLAALAGNVDMVRQQQEAANVAFNEAVSIDKEFNVQNTTVQAGLEKARKGFTEMAVTLGKELMPIVSKLISGTSMTMRVMLKVIQFVKEYKGYIIALTASIVAYYVVMKAQDAWNAFVGGCKRAITAVRSFNAALLSNPYAAIGALILGIGIALVTFIKRQREAAKAADENRKALERQQEAEKRIASSVGEVVSKYESLRQEWKRLSSEQEKKAWLEKNKEAFEQLGLNINSVIDADDAFVKNTDKVIAALKARAKAEALQDLYKDKMKSAYERAAEESQSAWNGTVSKGDMFATSNTKGDFGNTKNADVARAAGLGEGDYTTMAMSHRAGGDTYTYRLTEEGAKKVNEYYAKMAAEDAQKLTEQYAADVDKIYGDMYSAAVQEANAAEANTGGLVGAKKSGSTGGTVTGGGLEAPDEKELKKQHEAALKAVEDWKKKETALNQIAYLQGKKDFKAYTEENNKIEVEYWQKRMSVEKEGSTEYLQAQASYQQALKKQEEYATGQTVEAEQKRYSDEKAAADQQYADGKISAKAYQLELEQMELTHLQNLVNIYDEGSEERLKAQEKYNQTSLKYQQKHAQEAKKIEDQIKKTFFTESFNTSDVEEYKKHIAALEIVHNQLLVQAEGNNEERLKIDRAYYEAKYLLAKEYNQKEDMESMDSARAFGDEFLDFLNSDLGKKIAKGFSQTVSQMQEIFSSLTSLIDAETNIQTNKIEARYAAEIEAAGDNKEQVATLEAQKEEEIAKVHTEAANKKFTMQVIEAVANGIMSAVSAYAAGWELGAAGVFMAPAFMAISLASTGIQIAALKKQRDLAATQGYASGGYTMPGGKYQPAGIVHAGEWVASQELLANPAAAATIAQLDEAQRTNTIGQLDRQQVSRNVSPVASQSVATIRYSEKVADVDSPLNRLSDTLDRGIFATTTLTGDKGLLRAQRRYNQLIRNKS